MNDQKDICDLCGLAIEAVGFELQTTEGAKAFCCEGCKGIYQMLHEGDVLTDKQENTTVE